MTAGKLLTTRRIEVDVDAVDPAELRPVVEVLRAGGVVAGPTETFYGLMGAADRPEALARIAALKGRDGSKPLLLLVDDSSRAAGYASEWPESAEILAERFWPGPLTLLVGACSGLSPELSGLDGRVGVRVSGLALVRHLVRILGRAVTGTSANIAGKPPAATADEAAAYFDGRVDMIVDGGRCAGGSPSTIVDAGSHPPRLIRSGVLDLAVLRMVVPDLIS